MAVISGTDGSVTLPTGTGAKLTSWSATISQNTIDTTGFEDDKWGTEIGSQALKLRGSAAGFLKDETAPAIATVMIATGAAMELVAKANRKLAFSAILSEISLGNDRSGAGTISYNFVSDGVVTETWTG